MAESLPGTMSIFAEAYAEMIGSGETGQAALARFYKDVGTGSIESARIMPIVARMMSERAAPKIGVMKKTSIAEQGRFGGELADLLMIGSNAGVEQGFRNFWKGMTEGVRGLTPLVRALAGSFEDFTKLLRPFNLILDSVTRSFESLSKWSGVSEKNFANLAIVGGLMMTKWGRVGLLFSGIAMVLEDISMGISGEGVSVTGDILNWLEEGGIKLGGFERALFGVSAGLLAISVSMKALRGLGMLGNLFKIPTTNPDLVGPQIGRGRRAARAVPGLLRGAVPYVAGAAIYSAWGSFNTSTDEFREKYGLNFGQDSFLGDLGVRALGTLADLGNTLTMGYAEKIGEWLGGVTFDTVEWLKNYFTETKDNMLSWITDMWDSIMNTLRGQFDRFHAFMLDLIPEWARPASLREAPPANKTFEERTWFERLVWDSDYNKRVPQEVLNQSKPKANIPPAQVSLLAPTGTLDISVNATIDVATMDDFNDQFQERFSNVIRTTIQQYTTTE